MFGIEREEGDESKKEREEAISGRTERKAAEVWFNTELG